MLLPLFQASVHSLNEETSHSFETDSRLLKNSTSNFRNHFKLITAEANERAGSKSTGNSIILNS